MVVSLLDATIPRMELSSIQYERQCWVALHHTGTIHKLYFHHRMTNENVMKI